MKEQRPVYFRQEPDGTFSIVRFACFGKAGYKAELYHFTRFCSFADHTPAWYVAYTNPTGTFGRLGVNMYGQNLPEMILALLRDGFVSEFEVGWPTACVLLRVLKVARAKRRAGNFLYLPDGWTTCIWTDEHHNEGDGVMSMIWPLDVTRRASPESEN